MDERDRLYTFRYTCWGVKKSDTKKFGSMKDAIEYALHELPKQGYSDIQPPEENDYLKH